MDRIAFKMKLFPGFAAEYKKRHDEIWPELVEVLKTAGVRDYSIFLDEGTHVLYAHLKIDDTTLLDTLPAQKVMQVWWLYMGDIMETNPDHSPVSIGLKEMFYLP